MPTDPNITVTITVQLKGFPMPAAKQVEWTQVASVWHGGVNGIKLFAIEYAAVRNADGMSWVLYSRIPGYRDRIYVADPDAGKARAKSILEHFTKRIVTD